MSETSEQLMEKGLKEFFNKNYNSAIELLKSCNITNDNVKDALRLSYYNNAVITYNSAEKENDYIQAIEFYNNSLEYSNDNKFISETKNHIEKCNRKIYFLKAKDYSDKGDYENAITYYKKALESETDEENKRITIHNISVCFYNIGIMKMNLQTVEGFNSAIEYFKKSIENEKEIQGIEYINNCEIRIKECYSCIDYYESNTLENPIDKLSKINKAIEKWPEKESGINNIFVKSKRILLYNIGIQNYNENNYEIAKKYLQESIETKVIEEDVELTQKITYALNSADANIYYNNSIKNLEEKNYRAALTEIQIALNHAEKADNTNLIESCKNLKEKIESFIENEKKDESENENEEKEFNGDKNIIWLDINVNNFENKYYQESLKKEYLTFVFTNIQDVIEKLKQIEFEYTFVITSKTFFPIFIEEYKKEFKNLYVIPKIIIFTQSKFNFIEENKQKLPINDPIFNSGGIFDNFDELYEYLSSQNSNFNKTQTLKKTFTQTEKITSDKFTFEYISTKEELIAPLFYKYLITFPSNEDINSFSNNLIEKYKSSSTLLKLINQIVSKEENPNWPTPILSKYWLRAYTLETNFYSEMNSELRKGNFSNYQPYIQLLYNSLKDNSLKYYRSGNFYRGSYIDESEIENIKNYIKNKKENLPSCIGFSKSFLSFSLKEEVAHDYMENVIFVIKIQKEIDEINVSNVDLQKISYFKHESEILFFPFSVFEVSSIIEKDNYYEINLNYLGKYRDLFKNENPINLLKKNLPKTEFLKTSEKVIINKDLPLNKLNCICKFKNEGVGFFCKTTINKKEMKILITSYQIMNKEIENNILEYYVNDKQVQIDLIKNKKLRCFNENLDYYCIQIEDNVVENFFEIDEKMFSNNSFEGYKEENIYLIHNMNNNFTFGEGKVLQIDNEDKINHSISYNINTFGSPLILSKEKNYKIIGIQTGKNAFLMKKIIEDIENNLNHNYIKGYYNIENINKETQIINYSKENKNEIENNCPKITLNKKEQINFNVQIKFSKKGINEIKFDIKTPLINLKQLFSNCNTLTSIDLKYLNFSNVKNISNMFSKCKSLNKLNFGNIDTSNVITMYNMFSLCTSLKTLDLSNLNTSNVIDMSYLFYKCLSLETLNLSNLTNEKVTNMSCLLSGCLSLKNLNLDNFNTINVTNYSGMFWNCESLSNLNLKNFDTTNATNMFNMFAGCKNLEKLDVSNFNTMNVINMNSMFSDCIKLKTLDLKNFNFEKVNDISFMFNQCESLKNLNLNNFDNNNVSEMQWVFLGLNKKCIVITQNQRLLKEIKNY